MKVRRYKIGEEETLWQICRDTTLRVNVREYGTELVAKWASRPTDMTKWKDSTGRKNPFVAIADDTIVGFAEITKNGRISAFYSHYKWQRKGVGGVLYKTIEAEASRLKIDTLEIESSTSACGFFESRGFSVVEEKENFTDGIPSKSLLMRKHCSR